MTIFKFKHDETNISPDILLHRFIWSKAKTSITYEKAKLALWSSFWQLPNYYQIIRGLFSPSLSKKKQVGTGKLTINFMTGFV